MKKLLLLFAALCCTIVANAETQPNNQIWYTSKDGNVVNPDDESAFNVSIVSNTYENGKGVITFSGDLTDIGKKAFYFQLQLTSIAIPATVKSIGETAFILCQGLTTLTFAPGSQLETIGQRAFAYSGVSGELNNLPASLKRIEMYAFQGTPITAVTIPDSVTVIEPFTFNGTQLTKITLPETLTNIGASAFSATKISAVTIPASVTSIGESAFSATKISAVTIPASVTSIETSAFNECESLATLTFAPNSQLKTIGKEAFKGTALSGKLDYLPASLESIGEGAFYATAITAVTLPASLTKIGASAFGVCESLRTVVFPPDTHLQTIGQEAFYLTGMDGELTIPASVIVIGTGAFGRCSLTKVFMTTENLSRIGSWIFPESAVIITTAPLYEAYKAHFADCNTVEVPLKEWQEYTLGQIDAAMQTVNTLPDEDNAALAAHISTIEKATVVDETLETYHAALALIDRQKTFENKVKGALDTWCTRQNGPTVEIVGTDGRAIRLYNIKSVRYIKENKK